MDDVLTAAMHVIIYALALKALIWGCGGPTITGGWNEVVHHRRRNR